MQRLPKLVYFVPQLSDSTPVLVRPWQPAGFLTLRGKRLGGMETRSVSEENMSVDFGLYPGSSLAVRRFQEMPRRRSFAYLECSESSELSLLGRIAFLWIIGEIMELTQPEIQSGDESPHSQMSCVAPSSDSLLRFGFPALAGACADDR